MINLEEIEKILHENVKAKVLSILSNTDIGGMLNMKLNEFMETKVRTFKIPNASIPAQAIDFSDFKLPADKIAPGTISEFTSTGIEDIADSIQLTIMDGMVVAENKIVTNELVVNDRATIKNIDVEELRVSKRMVINDPEFSSRMINLINDTIAKDRKDNKLDIGGDSIYSNGNRILSGDALGPGVVTSNLRKVGRLQDLSITNDLSVGETLTAGNRKVGINTEEPAGALTVWDEDAEFTVRKHKAKTTFVGTTRDCDLVIGTNGNIVATLRRDGTLGTNKIEIGTVAISVSDQIPEHEGKPGEIVIMSKAVEGQPWAYQCLEGKQWAALSR